MGLVKDNVVPSIRSQSHRLNYTYAKESSAKCHILGHFSSAILDCSIVQRSLRATVISKPL